MVTLTNLHFNMKYLKTYEQVSINLTQQELNQILDKIGENGIDSLSNHEKTLLDNYDNPNFDKKEEIDKFQNKYLTSKGVTKDLGLSIENHPLEEDIGRYIKFKPEDMQGLFKNFGTVYEIVGIQKHWGHNDEGEYVPNMIGYRVAPVGKDDDFGTVCAIKEAIFVNMNEEDAIAHNKGVNKKIKEHLDKEG